MLKVINKSKIFSPRVGSSANYCKAFSSKVARNTLSYSTCDEQCLVVEIAYIVHCVLCKGILSSDFIFLTFDFLVLIFFVLCFEFSLLCFNMCVLPFF